MTERDRALAEAEELRKQARALKAKRVKALLAEGMGVREVARAVSLHHDTVRRIRADAERWVDG